MNRRAMATALRGTKDKGKANNAGICELLGLKPFTPHDLRRTAATLAGDLGFDDAWIAKCLDHAASRKQEQIVPSVTGKVYNHSKRMKEKRAVLDGVAAELRRIIGSWPDTGGNRTASWSPDQRQSPQINGSPVSAKLAGLFLLKPVKRAIWPLMRLPGARGMGRVLTYAAP